ncbi:putative electron transfer flavoprotein subunit [Physocladia obscura]|uniref:Electron transfer flavoprotein subunit n=1 Tax=Physocladia obscura TaxID=109957 RepID=A0AAD5SZK2_9FUNG|nr:putative electron transfer flavoprotein subunit [Physocladia obscura]
MHDKFMNQQAVPLLADNQHRRNRGLSQGDDSLLDLQNTADSYAVLVHNSFATPPLPVPSPSQNLYPTQQQQQQQQQQQEQQQHQNIHYAVDSNTFLIHHPAQQSAPQLYVNNNNLLQFQAIQNMQHERPNHLVPSHQQYQLHPSPQQHHQYQQHPLQQENYNSVQHPVPHQLHNYRPHNNDCPDDQQLQNYQNQQPIQYYNEPLDPPPAIALPYSFSLTPPPPQSFSTTPQQPQQFNNSSRSAFAPIAAAVAGEDGGSSSSPDPFAVHCINCHTTKTSAWRKDEFGRPICNACGLYKKQRGIDRPAAFPFRKAVVRRRNRVKKAGNRGIGNGSGNAGGNGGDGGDGGGGDDGDVLAAALNALSDIF